MLGAGWVSLIRVKVVARRDHQEVIGLVCTPDYFCTLAGSSLLLEARLYLLKHPIVCLRLGLGLEFGLCLWVCLWSEVVKLVELMHRFLGFNRIMVGKAGWGFFKLG